MKSYDRKSDHDVIAISLCYYSDLLQKHSSTLSLFQSDSVESPNLLPDAACTLPPTVEENGEWLRDTSTKAAEKANAMGETTLEKLVITLTFFGFGVF